jgi:hypothetical protein
MILVVNQFITTQAVWNQEATPGEEKAAMQEVKARGVDLDDAGYSMLDIALWTMTIKAEIYFDTKFV